MQGSETGDKLSVLVVDGDSNELKALVIGLELEGFAAEGAESSRDALVAVERGTYSLVLIDLMLPETNGLQLARRIRSLRPGLPTVLMSSYHLSPAQLSRADTGAVGFVPKPFRFDDFVRYIGRKARQSPEPTRPSIRPPARRGDPYSPFDVP